MDIGLIEGATRHLGAPQGWDQERDGACDALPIRDMQDMPGGQNRMVSAWFPTPDEIVAIMGGAPVFLSVVGAQHPPVMLSVGDPLKEGA